MYKKVLKEHNLQYTLADCDYESLRILDLCISATVIFHELEERFKILTLMTLNKTNLFISHVDLDVQLDSLIDISYGISTKSAQSFRESVTWLSSVI